MSQEDITQRQEQSQARNLITDYERFLRKIKDEIVNRFKDNDIDVRDSFALTREYYLGLGKKRGIEEFFRKINEIARGKDATWNKGI